MTLNEVIKESKNYKNNNFVKLFFIVLLELIITTVLSKLGESFELEVLRLIYSILLYAISIPLSYGVVISFIKNSRNDSIALFDFISDGFKNFKNIWRIIGRTVLKLIIPVIVLILGTIIASVLYTFSLIGIRDNGRLVAMIISIGLMLASVGFFIYKAIAYSLVTYVLYDNPELSSSEILEKSAELMVGNKWTFVFISLYICALILVLSIACFAIAALNYIVALVVLLIGANAILAYSYSLQTAFYNLLKDNN